MEEKLFPIETRHFFIKPGNEEKLWGEEWTVSLKKGEQESVGGLHFAGPVTHGEVEIGVDLDSSYKKSGYYAEIFYSMARFVFKFRDISEIRSICRHEDDHLVRGLEKADYVRRETKDGYDYYSMKKQKSAWTGFYIFIGLIAGFMMGIVFSNLKLGVIAGVAIGVLIGYLMDK